MTPQPVRDDETAVVLLVRWTCPICWTSKLAVAHTDNEHDTGVINLQAHIHRTIGRGHGDQHSFPKGFDPTTLPEHVEIETRVSVE